MITKKNIAIATAVGGIILIAAGTFRINSLDIRKQLQGIGVIIAGSSFYIAGTMMYHQQENLKEKTKEKQ